MESYPRDQKEVQPVSMIALEFQHISINNFKHPATAHLTSDLTDNIVFNSSAVMEISQDIALEVFSSCLSENGCRC